MSVRSSSTYRSVVPESHPAASPQLSRIVDFGLRRIVDQCCIVNIAQEGLPKKGFVSSRGAQFAQEELCVRPIVAFTDLLWSQAIQEGLHPVCSLKKGFES